MAIYHFKSQIIKRSAGRSATSAAAYRARDLIKDDRTGLIFDYRHIPPANHLEILAPDNVPPWVKDRASLWNEVEKAEKRKDSQLAREIMVALPNELSRSEQISLGKKFIQENYVSKGMIADLAFHDLDSSNPHLHVMLTMRTISSQGFGLKERDWNPGFKKKRAKGDRLEIERQLWQDYTNQALATAGEAARVDCRSLKDRGLERIPQIHLGAFASTLEKRGVRTARGDEHRRIAIVNLEIAQLKLQSQQITREIERQKQRQKEKIQKQQQELKRHSENLQTKPNKSSARSEDLAEVIRMISGRKKRSLGNHPQGKNGFDSNRPNSANKKDTNDSNPGQKVSFEEILQLREQCYSQPNDLANNPEPTAPPQNTNLASNQNNRELQEFTPQTNKKSSESYYGLVEKFESKLAAISEKQKKPIEKPTEKQEQQPPSDNNLTSSASKETSPNNSIDNRKDFLDLGLAIYNQTPLQELCVVEPNIWEVRGNQYTLRFNRNQMSFTISDLTRGKLIEAKFDNSVYKIVSSSAISQSDLDIFKSQLLYLNQKDSEHQRKLEELKREKSKGFDLEL